MITTTETLAQPIDPRQIQGAFFGLPKQKLDELIAQGYRINGFSVSREVEGSDPQRGFITVDGLVGWWTPGLQALERAHVAMEALRMRCEQVEAAIEEAKAVERERDELRAHVEALTARCAVTHRKVADAAEAMSWAMANCDIAGRSYFFERKLEGLRGVLADAPTPQALTRPASFPERDTTRPAEQQGLFRKFAVRRVDGSDAPGGKHHGCEYFVLDMDHDKAAPAALVAYADAVAATHPQLAADLRARFGEALTRPAVPEGTGPKLDWIWRTLRGIADRGRQGLGDSYPEVVQVLDAVRACQKELGLLAAAPLPDLSPLTTPEMDLVVNRAHAYVRQALSAVPEGWPTNKMIEAGRKAAETHGLLLGNGQSLWHVFRDMLAAAPQPSKPEAVQPQGEKT